MDRASIGGTLVAVLEDLTYMRRQLRSAQPALRAALGKFGRSLSMWLACGAGTIALLLWNWQLVCATAAGIATLVLAYLIPTRYWQQVQTRVLQVWQGIPRHMTLAVVSSGIVATFVYAALAIWTAATDRWLAAGAIAQSVATFLTLGLLGWHVFERQPQRSFARDRYLRELTHADALKRLIAVRLLSERALTGAQAERKHLGEYFCLLHSRESEPLVRAAILDSLHRLELAPPPPRPQPLLALEKREQPVAIAVPKQLVVPVEETAG
ncbi:hypothetical protein KR51_00008960 [Rubidibacter lacunae KORDI 51-2]|uniref:Uncharacterized protein n=1 Tax=Rubidibacter lacunae KORDI 51-2 TaxID=582515 RepID=U5DRQ7_9CHRO|nr:hypothetical protein [Rubidibacter lacunae]ERN42375.1 hypothetical protein KR51_00008960 [Rubidibacter lacunae KORDI 51-2]